MTQTHDAMYRLAALLLGMYWRLDEAAPRTKAYTAAKAHLDGACDTAHALGIGHTPFAVLMAVLDTAREAGERPPYEPARNAARKEYDGRQAHALATRLAAL